MNDADIALSHGAEFRRCLIEVDVAGVMKLWKHVQPNLPQPANEKEALFTLHMARANAETIPPRLRVYSDRWLRERGLGSFMPHELRPKGWKVRG